jgi:hypothetical protein
MEKKNRMQIQDKVIEFKLTQCKALGAKGTNLNSSIDKEH